MSKLISIIVPVYNAGKYLLPLIESILGQTYQNIELILVDDGSSDGSGIICDEFAKKDERVKVIHTKNSGQSSARNTGLEIATGDLIAFADHDDLLHPQMYEIMVHAMLENDMLVCICDFANVQQDQFDDVTFNQEDAETTVLTCEEWLNGFFEPTWRTPIWNKLYRKEVVNNIRFGNLHLGEDNLFSYQVFKESRNAVFVHKTLYFQRMHGDNFEYTGIKYFTDLLLAKEMILNDVKNVFPYIYDSFRILFLDECVRIFNVYVSTDIKLYNNQKEQVIKMIQKNSKSLWFSSMPIGRKLRFFKLKYKTPNLINEPISM
ncbi:MAG: glycosyltransferase [Ruminococcus sp.]|nr:glycosyltransferase [Ruminococcus sp.]